MNARASTTRSSTRYKVGIAIAAITCVGMLLGAVFLGGRLVDKGLIDTKSELVSAWIVTREVAPGDEFSLQLFAAGELRAIRAGVGGGPLVEVWKSDGTDDEHDLLLRIPPDAPTGLVVIALEVDLNVRVEVNRMLNTVYYRDSSRHDKVELTLPVRSPEARTNRQWLFRALGVGSWLAVLGLVYAIARWSFRGLLARMRRKGESMDESIAAVLCVVVACGFAALGQFLFVRPILRTTTFASWQAVLCVQVVWICAIGLGLWRGLRARARAPAACVWDPARLRPVVGSGGEGGYREAGSTLPPWMSRDAERVGSARLIEALRSIGCDVTRKGNVLDVTRGAEPVMRFRVKGSEPWSAEDLGVSIPGGTDGAPLVLALSDLFGPLEYTAPGCEAVILEKRA